MSLLSIILFFFVGTAHPFHVSVCDVDMNGNQSRLEITHKIFIDDLEIALRQFSNNDKLDILKQYDSPYFLELMKGYYQTKVKFKTNGKVVEHLFLGIEKYNDVLWCYSQVSNVKQLKVFEMENNILTESFEDQMNLVHVKVDGKTKSLRLRQNESCGSLTF